MNQEEERRPITATDVKASLMEAYPGVFGRVVISPNIESTVSYIFFPPPVEQPEPLSDILADELEQLGADQPTAPDLTDLIDDLRENYRDCGLQGCSVCGNRTVDATETGEFDQSSSLRDESDDDTMGMDTDPMAPGSAERWFRALADGSEEEVDCPDDCPCITGQETNF